MTTILSELEAESLTPITSPTLHHALTGRLRAMIIDGVLAPGSKINEAALCKPSAFPEPRFGRRCAALLESG